jgi:serine/threonine-protein kinase
MKSSGQAPLPSPPQDPIVRLVGRGHQEQSEPCAMNADFDQTTVRVGD